MDNIDFVDESGDREHFTIIPNYIANHSSAVDQALYFQMKKHAGERGECFASHQTLMTKLKIGHKALIKSINYLLEHKWISLKGYKLVETNGGPQSIKIYVINNIWKINSDYYHQLYDNTKGSLKSEYLRSKGLLKASKGSLKSETNKITINKIIQNTSTSNTELQELTKEQLKTLSEVKKHVKESIYGKREKDKK